MGYGEGAWASAGRTSVNRWTQGSRGRKGPGCRAGHGWAGNPRECPTRTSTGKSQPETCETHASCIQELMCGGGAAESVGGWGGVGRSMTRGCGETGLRRTLPPSRGQCGPEGRRELAQRCGRSRHPVGRAEGGVLALVTELDADVCSSLSPGPCPDPAARGWSRTLTLGFPTRGGPPPLPGLQGLVPCTELSEKQPWVCSRPRGLGW